MNEFPPDQGDRVTDEIAQHLLERAATLDQEGPQLAHLRERAERRHRRRPLDVGR